MTKERFNKHVNYSIYGCDMSKNEWYTGEEFDQGYHFCQDWDGLFIAPDSEEFKCCTCHPLKRSQNDKKNV